MASEESKRKRIMEFSFKKFTTMGIPHVTMDEISRGVGIGKGTLYKFFPSKEALLFATIDFIAGVVEKKIEDLMNDEKLTAVEKLSLLIKTVAERLSSINPAALSYLERSLPEAFDKIVEIRERLIMKNLIRLFEEGKKSGLFEPEMDNYLTAHILIGAANHIIDGRVLSKLNYKLDELFNTITSTLMKGCLTEAGRKQVIKSTF